MKKKKELKYNRERRRIIICFLIVPLAFLIYFTIYPVTMMFIYSFTNWKGSATPYDFIGIKNYITIFLDDTYRTVFKTTAMYLVAGVLQQIISLFLAVIMSENLRFGKFIKGIIFFPFIMNGVAVALAFRIFYQENGGLDMLLKFFHLGNYIQNWISNPKTVNLALCFIFLWKNIGYSFLIYLGTMQSVDRELYEAAAIDGAGAWKKFVAITFPNIKMIVGLMGTMSIINSITVFDVPYVLTSGQNGTATFATKLVDTAFKYGQYGEASAMAIIMLVIAGVVMIFKNIFFKEETYV